MNGIKALIPFTLIGFLIYFMNKLALSTLQPILSGISSVFALKSFLFLFWTIPYLSLALTLYGLRKMQLKNGLGFLGNLGFNSLITLFFVMLSLIFVKGISKLIALMSSASSAIIGVPEIPFGSNQTYLLASAWIGIALALFMIGYFVYGMIKGKYKYKVHKHVLSFPDLPEAFDGFKITQISDVHSGSFDNEKAVTKGVEMIKKQNSDLFLFTGDLVNNLASEFEPWKKLFSTIRAPFGQFSVLGNHDYGDYVAWESVQHKAQNLENLKQHQADIGFRLLQDESIELEKDNQKIHLIGVQNWGHGFAKIGDLSKALSGLDQTGFKILLSHDPTHFEHEVKNHDTHIHLTLSGHTHGMQMGIDLPWFKWSPVKWRYKKWAGLYQENNRYLHINRGFGFLGFSGRVGIWPEITVIELRKSA